MILIIHKKLSEARVVASMFRCAGILAFPIRPHEVSSAFSPMFRAVLLASDEGIYDLPSYISDLRKKTLEVPLYSLSDADPRAIFFADSVFPYDIYPAKLIRGILDDQTERKRPRIGDYRLAGIDASIDRNAIYRFGTKIDLTATESLILRFLIRAYPLAVSPATIIRFVFPTVAPPEEAGIRTHLSAINRKFEEATGSRLTERIPEQGYRIATPVPRFV